MLRFRNFLRSFSVSKGFTLVELLVVSVILIVAVGAILTLFATTMRSFSAGIHFLGVYVDAKAGIGYMVKDIKLAYQVVPSRTVSGSFYATGTEEIILEIPAIDSDGDVIDDTYDYVIYHLQTSGSTVLNRLVDADDLSSRSDGDRTISKDVGYVEFSSGGTELDVVTDVTALTSVNVILRTSKSAFGDKTYEITLSSGGRLRNKE